jgi:integrase
MADASREYEPVRAGPYWPYIGAFVRAAVTDAAPRTAYSERELYAAATPLTLWAWQTAAMPLEREVIFALHTIERFIAVGLPQYRSKSGRNTIRSRLLRINEVLLHPPSPPPRLRPLGRSDPSMPYTAAEVAALKSWATTQNTPGRRSNAEALLALGLGAGLAGREIVNLTVSDIRADDDGVLVEVRGDRARVVPVLREWERSLREHVDLACDTWVFREQHVSDNRNLITDFVSRSEGKIQLQARRMHATWIVHHLEAGTPLVPLMRAAGLTSPEALDRFLKFVRAPDPQISRNAVRDAVAAPR